MGLRLGVDVGGTKIEIVAMDASGRELVRRRVPTPAGNYRGTIDAIVALVRGVEAECGGPLPVGVGMPGALSPASGLMQNANSTILIGKPFVRDLEAALERPVRAANDANCLALSEATDGAAHDARVVFAAILGTGVGGAIAIDRSIITGRHAIAGEWGHNPLPWPLSDELPGPPCYCGKRGCIETFLSGPGLARDFSAAGAHDATAIVAAAQAGDRSARATLARYEDRLARALASVINIIDPDTIVLGGGLSNIEGLPAKVRVLLETYVLSSPVTTPIVRAAHGDSSGVRGAAMLWPAACSARADAIVPGTQSGRRSV